MWLLWGRHLQLLHCLAQHCDLELLPLLAAHQLGRLRHRHPFPLLGLRRLGLRLLHLLDRDRGGGAVAARDRGLELGILLLEGGGLLVGCEQSVALLGDGLLDGLEALGEVGAALLRLGEHLLRRLRPRERHALRDLQRLKPSLEREHRARRRARPPATAGGRALLERLQGGHRLLRRRGVRLRARLRHAQPLAALGELVLEADLLVVGAGAARRLLDRRAVRTLQRDVLRLLGVEGLFAAGARELALRVGECGVAVAVGALRSRELGVGLEELQVGGVGCET